MRTHLDHDDDGKVIEIPHGPIPRWKTQRHNIMVIALLKNLKTQCKMISWYTSGFT